MFPDECKSVIEEIRHPLLLKKEVSVFIKRDDLIHPNISGNKWRKLKYNLKEAKEVGHDSLLTFGGAFSNHILAVANAGKLYGFKTIGIIRGESSYRNNPTLSSATEVGMQLEFISRNGYRRKNEASFISEISNRLGDFYLIPEGGSNCLAIKGCQEILSTNERQFDTICCSVGTGGTLAGIISASSEHQRIFGFSALKGSFLTEEVQSLLTSCGHDKFNNWEINEDYHFGGYAKYSDELITFMNEFYDVYDIKTDPIYTGKLFYGVFDLIKKDRFNAGSRILILHTGGLQGIKGFNILHSQAINFD